MYAQSWNVLIVDDEPDVLSITRLALKNVAIYGVPVRVHTASSKAEAEKHLQTTFSHRSGVPFEIAVAIIDVVMETDHAGLELCQILREDLNNRSMQIYIRTGQPGRAPERSVVDRYEINGYLSKPETTADKLYSLVKSGVREYGFIKLAQEGNALLHALIQVADSREEMLEVIRDFRTGMQDDSSGRKRPDVDIQSRYFINDRDVEAGGMEEGTARALRDRLATARGVKLNDDGDRYVADGSHFLIEIAANRTCSAITYVSRAIAAPPDAWLHLIHGNLRSFAALWKKAESYSSSRI